MKLCECGCGKEVLRESNRFLLGHSGRGKGKGPRCLQTGFSCSTAYWRWKCQCEACQKWADAYYNNPKRHERKHKYNRSPKGRKKRLEYHFRRTYGITLEQYDEMLRQQGGRCAICHRGPGKDKRLYVDHKKRNKKHPRLPFRGVRKLLCDSCNRGIGDFGEDPERLRNAAAYLEAYLVYVESIEGSSNPARFFP